MHVQSCVHVYVLCDPDQFVPVLFDMYRPPHLTCTVLPPLPTSSIKVPPPPELAMPLPPPAILIGNYQGPVVAADGSSLKVKCESNVEDPSFTWNTAGGSGQLPAGVTVSMTSPNVNWLNISSITGVHYTRYVCSVSSIQRVCGQNPASRTFEIFEPGIALIIVRK